MKKSLGIFLSLILAFSVLVINASAESDKNVKTSNITYFEDGSYVVTVLTETDGISRATSTKTGQKTTTYYGSDDVAIWKATLTGTFSYTGSSSSCTAASVTYEIYNDNWKIPSATATKSSNKAIADITAKRYLLGIPVQTVEKTITITCSASGTLS